MRLNVPVLSSDWRQSPDRDRCGVFRAGMLFRKILYWDPGRREDGSRRGGQARPSVLMGVEMAFGTCSAGAGCSSKVSSMSAAIAATNRACARCRLVALRQRYSTGAFNGFTRATENVRGLRDCGAGAISDLPAVLARPVRAHDLSRHRERLPELGWPGPRLILIARPVLCASEPRCAPAGSSPRRADSGRVDHESWRAACPGEPPGDCGGRPFARGCTGPPITVAVRGDAPPAGRSRSRRCCLSPARTMGKRADDARRETTQDPVRWRRVRAESRDGSPPSRSQRSGDEGGVSETVSRSVFRWC